MKVLIILFLLLSHCAHNDFDLNPWTTVGKKMLEVNFEN
jgi:hypothetical protein